MKEIYVEKDSYFDSVVLMLINRQIKKIDGVTQAVVAMGTPMNLDLLGDLQMINDAVKSATANDLIIAIEAEDAQVVSQAMEVAKKKLTEKGSAEESDGYKPATLSAAIKTYADINMVVISPFISSQISLVSEKVGPPPSSWQSPNPLS